VRRLSVADSPTLDDVTLSESISTPLCFMDEMSQTLLLRDKLYPKSRFRRLDDDDVTIFDELSILTYPLWATSELICFGRSSKRFSDVVELKNVWLASMSPSTNVVVEMSSMVS
jgi:hypothetical protein